MKFSKFIRLPTGSYQYIECQSAAHLKTKASQYTSDARKQGGRVSVQQFRAFNNLIDDSLYFLLKVTIVTQASAPHSRARVHTIKPVLGVSNRVLEKLKLADDTLQFLVNDYTPSAIRRLWGKDAPIIKSHSHFILVTDAVYKKVKNK